MHFVISTSRPDSFGPIYEGTMIDQSCRLEFRTIEFPAFEYHDGQAEAVECSQVTMCDQNVITGDDGKLYTRWPEIDLGDLSKPVKGYLQNAILLRLAAEPKSHFPFLLSTEAGLHPSVHPVRIKLLLASLADSPDMVAKIEEQLYCETVVKDDTDGLAEDYRRTAAGFAVVGLTLPVSVNHLDETILGALLVERATSGGHYEGRLLLVKDVPLRQGMVLERRMTWHEGETEEMAFASIAQIVSFQ